MNNDCMKKSLELNKLEQEKLQNRGSMSKSISMVVPDEAKEAGFTDDDYMELFSFVFEAMERKTKEMIAEKRGAAND